MYWLAVISFAESSFFLVPPDVLIIPMVLANRPAWFKIALVCTFASVLGGLFGYFIGATLFGESGRPSLDFYHAAEKFETARALYNENGVLIVFTAGFSPVPYKIFTIASGVTVARRPSTTKMDHSMPWPKWRRWHGHMAPSG